MFLLYYDHHQFSHIWNKYQLFGNYFSDILHNV